MKLHRFSPLAVLALIVVCVPVAWAGASFQSSSLRGVVLAPTPIFLNKTGPTGALDLDSSPILCQTESHTPMSESTARMDSWVSLGVGGTPTVFLVRNAISTNGGGTWQNADSVASVGASHGLSEGYTDIGSAGNSAVIDLTPGNSYVFGVRASRGGGLNDPPDGACEVLVEITQDPGSPGPPGPPGIEPGSPPPGPLP
jgi:hypothetical protein